MLIDINSVIGVKMTQIKNTLFLGSKILFYNQCYQADHAQSGGKARVFGLMP